MIYIPAATENLSLGDHNGINAGIFSINGYTEAYANNQAVVWVNDTYNVPRESWWFGPYDKEPAGSCYAMCELKLTGTSSSTTIDHLQDSYT